VAAPNLNCHEMLAWVSGQNVNFKSIYAHALRKDLPASGVQGACGERFRCDPTKASHFSACLLIHYPREARCA
jgi:hypothetical protein